MRDRTELLAMLAATLGSGTHKHTAKTAADLVDSAALILATAELREKQKQEAA